jgi:hypothetical protein
MLSFKQYLREAVVTIPGKGNVLARPTTKSEPIAVEGIPNPSTQDRRASKLSALITGRQKEAAAAGAAERTADVGRGANMVKGILGEKVPVVNNDGKITGTKLKGGVFAALSGYDAGRRARGVAVRKTSYDDKLRQIGVNAVGSMSQNPSASGPNLLRTLGTAARVGSNVKTGVSNAVSNVGSGLEDNSNNLANKAIGGTDPLSQEDRNAAMLKAATSSKLNSGQAAQTVGMQPTPTRQSGENTADAAVRMSQPQGTSSFETQLNKQNKLESPAPLSQSYGSAAEIAKKQEEELAKRMAQIGNRPGFERTKQKYTQTVLAKTNPQAVAPTQQRPANLGAGSMYEEIIKIINRDHR